MWLLPTVGGMSKSTHFLTLKQALQRLADLGLTVSDETIRRWSKSGKLPATQLPSGHRRYRIEDIDALVGLGSVEAGPERVA